MKVSSVNLSKVMSSYLGADTRCKDRRGDGETDRHDLHVRVSTPYFTKYINNLIPGVYKHKYALQESVVGKSM
jgi:hypothetical protein